MRRSHLIFCLAFWGMMDLAPALTIQLDFSYDAANGNFFGKNPLAKAAVEAAAADLGAVITTPLSAVTTDVYKGVNGSTTATFDWSVNFTNPSTGAGVTLQAISLPANTIRIYVGMQKLGPKASELGDGGPGGAGFSLVGSGQPSEWVNAIKNGQTLSNAAMSRGSGPVIGTLSGSSSLGDVNADYTLKYGIMVGNIWFNKDTDKDGAVDDEAKLDNFWHYDHTKPVAPGKTDFYSVALHELIHSLGFGQSAAWRAAHTGTTWGGTKAKVLNGNSGAQLVSGDNVHIAVNLVSNRISDGLPQEVAMDPTILAGTRKSLTAMDVAFLGDLGYVAPILPVPVTNGADVLSNTSAWIQGSVILKSSSATAALEYGTSTLYGLSKNFVLPASIPNFNASTPVSIVLKNLEPGVTYHYRVKGINPDGNANGADAVFTLPAAPLAANIICDNGPVSFSPLTPGGAPGLPVAGVTILVPGDSLLQKIESVSNGAFGKVSINGSQIAYTPEQGYFGEDTFSYTVAPVASQETPGVKPSGGPSRRIVQVRSSSPLGSHIVAAKGDDIPGATAGTVYGSIGTPAIGPFAGNQQGSEGIQRAIFSLNGNVIFKENESLAALGGKTIAKFGEPSGQAVLASFKIGPDVTAKNDEVLIAGLHTGGLRMAAREGTALPGLPSGVTIKRFGSIDGNGPLIFFTAALQGEKVTSKNDGVLCAALPDGSVKILVREGQTVAGKTVTVFILGSMVGLQGTLADGRWLAGTDEQPAIGIRVTFSDKNQAIYKISASDASWTKLADTNGELGLDSLGLPGFGPEGVAFIGKWKQGAANVTSDNDTALFFSQGNVTTVLARKADLAPGSDGVANSDNRFKAFSDPVAGAGKRGAFTGTVTGSTVESNNCTGLWSFAPGAKGVRLLARAGDAAPGGGKWAAFPSLVMSDGPEGGAIFLATRVVESGSPLTAKNNLGLWAVDTKGNLQTLIQTGQLLKIGDTTKEVASFVALKAAAGSMGSAQGYDNKGHVAVLATFKDGTVALISATVP